MNKRTLLYISLFFIVSSAFGASVAKFDPIIQADPRISFGKGIAEGVAPTSGELNVTYEAVSIDGVGIPINVYLNYNSNGVAPFSDTTLGSGAFGHLSLTVPLYGEYTKGKNTAGMYFNTFGLTSELGLISEGMVQELLMFVTNVLKPLGLKEVVDTVIQLINVEAIDNTNAHTFLTQFTPQATPIKGVYGGFVPFVQVNVQDTIKATLDTSTTESEKLIDKIKDIVWKINNHAASQTHEGFLNYITPPSSISVIYGDGSTVPFKRKGYPIQMVTDSDTTYEFLAADPSVNTILRWNEEDLEYEYITKDGTKYLITPKTAFFLNMQFFNENTLKQIIATLEGQQGYEDTDLIDILWDTTKLTLYGFKYGLVTKVVDPYENELNLEYSKQGLSKVTDSLGRAVNLEYNHEDPDRSDNPYCLSAIRYLGENGTQESIRFDYDRYDHSSGDVPCYNPRKIEIRKPINDSEDQIVNLYFKHGHIDNRLGGVIKDLKSYFTYLNRIDYATGGFVKYETAPIDDKFYNRYFYKMMDLTKERVFKRMQYESRNAKPLITEFQYDFDVHNDWMVTGGLHYYPPWLENQCQSLVGDDSFIELNLNCVKLEIDISGVKIPLGSLFGGAYFQLVKEVKSGTVTRIEPNGHRIKYHYKKNNPGSYNHFMLNLEIKTGIKIIGQVGMQTGYYPAGTRIFKTEEGLESGVETIVTLNTYNDARGPVLTFTDPISKIVGTGLLTKTDVKRGLQKHSLNYTYDNYGNVKSEIGSWGLSGYNMSYDYLHEDADKKNYAENGFRNLVKQTTSYQDYSKKSGLIKTRYEYDSDGTMRGELNKVIQYDGINVYSRTRMEFYNSGLKAGLLSSQTDSLGNTANFTYLFNPGNNIIHSVTDAENITTTSEFDWHLGRLKTETAGNGNSSSYEYDDLGRIIRVIFPDNTDLKYNYFDGIGDLRVEVENVLNVKNRYHYDGLGRLKKLVQDPGGFNLVLTNHYDDHGNLSKMVDSENRATDLEYDTYNRLKRIRYPDGTQLLTKYNYRYGENRYFQTVKDANKIEKEYIFDGFNNLVMVREPIEQDKNIYAVAEYHYDDVGNLLKMTDPEEKETGYTYDKLNRLIKTSYPDGTIEKQEYDKIGNVKKKYIYSRTYSGDPEAPDKFITYEYDNIYRLTAISYPRLDLDYALKRIEYEYDFNGNRTKVSEYLDDGNLLGETAYTYDIMDRLSADTRKNNAVSGDLEFENVYGYNTVGALTLMTYPCGRAVEYTLDRLQRTTSLKLIGDPDNIAEYDYNRMGTIKSISYGNSVSGNFEYDIRDRLTKLKYINSDLEEDKDLLLKHRYIYDKVGNRKRIVENDPMSGAINKTTDYLYDDLYRLTYVEHRERPASNARYEYDESGNRTFMHQDNGDYEYKMETDSSGNTVSNKLVEVISNNSGHTYLSYDSNGNLIKEEEYLGTKETGILKYEKKYFWDYENRLLRVETKRTDVSDTFTVDFAYNGSGLRILKEVGVEDTAGADTLVSSIMYIRNSMGEVVEEYTFDENDGSWDLADSYIFGNGKRIMSITPEDSRTYFTSDILGSNSLLTDGAGQPTMLTKYDEFGNISYEWALNSEHQSQAPNYKYTGKPYDKELGLYYYGARYYHAKWGRWVKKDIKRSFNKKYTQAMNYNIFTLNNPLKYVDLDGRAVYVCINRCSDLLPHGHAAIAFDLYDDNGKLTGKVEIHELYAGDNILPELERGDTISPFWQYQIMREITFASAWSFADYKKQTLTNKQFDKELETYYTFVYQIKTPPGEGGKMENLVGAKLEEYRLKRIQFSPFGPNCMTYVFAGLKAFSFSRSLKSPFPSDFGLWNVQNSGYGVEKHTVEEFINRRVDGAGKSGKIR